LACDGLYALIDAEQRGRHYPKLMSYMACHRGQRRNADDELNAARPACCRTLATTQDRAPYVRSAFAPRKRRLYRTLRSRQRSSSAQRSGARRRPSNSTLERRQRRGNEEIFSTSEGAGRDALILFSDQAT
jgi:hypothetical protein